MSSTTTQNGTATPSAKSSRTTPEDVELEPMPNGQPGPSIPLEEDIMQCARIGAIEHVQNLFKSGKFDPKYHDEEGITPLHVGEGCYHCLEI